MTTFNDIITSAFKSDEPKIGRGVTEMCYTDRHAYTIIECRDARHCVVQRDHATRTDDRGMSDAQEYRYEPNPDGRIVELSLRKDGHWRQVGERKGSNVFMIGRREEYYDYSF